MARGEDFIENAKCSHGHRSAMSNSAWSDLNRKCTVLKLLDMCHKPKCKCQKQITFTPKLFQLQGGSTKTKLTKTSRGTKKNGDSFIRTGLKMATPLISVAVAAKTKKPQSAQITNNILKTLIAGKILTLTDMHGKGLKVKVM